MSHASPPPGDERSDPTQDPQPPAGEGYGTPPAPPTQFQPAQDQGAQYQTPPPPAPGAGYGPPPPADRQQGYGQAPAYTEGAYGGAPQTNSKARTSMILGIVGLVICGILGPVAIILSRMGSKEIAASGGRQKGSGLAQAGLILGIVTTVLWVVGLVLRLAAVANS